MTSEKIYGYIRSLKDSPILFYNESLLGNITYLNCMDLYADDGGFMKTELLNENDSHVNTGDLFIESLSLNTY